MRARGRTQQPREGMNKMEAEHAQGLRLRQLAGEVLWFGFEVIKLKLAPKTFFTPDFVVQYADGTLGFEEVKGSFWEDDARVKIKVAAKLYPLFPFVAYQKQRKRDGGGWKVEEFHA